MLDKKSKKVLKFLNKLVNWSHHYSYTDFESIKQVLKFHEFDLNNCLDYLIKLDLVETMKGNKKKMYRSTIKGITYFQVNFKTILIDIIVSVITTLIALISAKLIG